MDVQRIYREISTLQMSGQDNMKKISNYLEGWLEYIQNKSKFLDLFLQKIWNIFTLKKVARSQHANGLHFQSGQLIFSVCRQTDGVQDVLVSHSVGLIFSNPSTTIGILYSKLCGLKIGRARTCCLKKISCQSRLCGTKNINDFFFSP